MADLSPGAISVGGDVIGSILITGSQNTIIQAAQAAQAQGRDPARMLRILAVLAAPVLDPDQPDRLPPPLDLQQEWHELSQTVRESHAPILLARIVPPTLDDLRRALSLRAEAQDRFPHILHFSGHAWKRGLLLEDEMGRVHHATTDEILAALKREAPDGRAPGLPIPLVVLNGCESAADADAVAQMLVETGLARAAIGHTRPVSDPQAIRFAARLYAELTDGSPLREAVDRAQKAVTTPSQGWEGVRLLGDENLHFEQFTGGKPWIDDRCPPGNLPARAGFFLGRGPQLIRIAEALAHPPKVILLTGPAAIGKSSLALEAAHRNAWRFPGGVAFAEGPHPESDRPGTLDDLLNRLAEALGLKTEPGRVAETLSEQTRLQPTLLILDNVESLPPADLKRLRDFLNHLGTESAALLLARPTQSLLEDLPCALPLSLHEGIGEDAALRYIRTLARVKGIPLQPQQAEEIAQATDGHPRLIELVVAQAGRRDLRVLLQEVRERRGDFARQLERLYEWSATRLDEAGRAAWQALLLFPAGQAPEGPLRAAAGEGLEALCQAALTDFAPVLQAWRWHATVGEYARLHWPLADDERRARLSALLPAWTAWLEGLPPKTPEAATRLEAQQDNLDLLLQEARPAAAAQGGAPDFAAFLDAVRRVLPAPDKTLALRGFEERFYRAWVDLATEEKERAQALNGLGYALSALGRRAEALATAQEAADLYRELAQANPQAFLPDLAGSLNNLGAMLAALGQREEALAATQEAANLYRELAQANPLAFLPDLAGSLNNLGNALSALGRREEALATTQEAAALYRELAQANPQAFLPYLAGRLNNLGAMLAALGRREEALAAAQEAADLYRELAQADPQAFLPDLAMSLTNLGASLAALGRRAEALAAAQKAADLYRELAQANPQAFLPYLAGGLNNLGAMLADLGRREEALAATQEAADLYRGLAQANPQAFLPDLARSLGVYGFVLLDLGRAQEAQEAFAEGLRAIRPLAQAHPAAFGDLAAMLEKGYLWARQKVEEEEKKRQGFWGQLFARFRRRGSSP